MIKVGKSSESIVVCGLKQKRDRVYDQERGLQAISVSLQNFLVDRITFEDFKISGN